MGEFDIFNIIHQNILRITSLELSNLYSKVVCFNMQMLRLVYYIRVCQITIPIRSCTLSKRIVKSVHRVYIIVWILEHRAYISLPTCSSGILVLFRCKLAVWLLWPSLEDSMMPLKYLKGQPST